ncbi:hypothetical protein AT15_09360 [Kosmotoga arenicorallina S304]|uniref:Uncharacterized protein n=1 Tax=Kosmotoga arenicorallina S304 TaxID=1453497 RepID=A0A176K1A6_9BACT|nr:hypothetical protein [Kosmotoga arenicorallina]OAA30880.1 hypothetical protein AT15_09360 [Kosmotoga arenicorallina S304]
MNNYVHIIYDETSYFSPKKINFDHRTKSGMMVAWSQEQAQKLLDGKYWKCLSAYGLEAALRRKIVFERKHSDINLLYFKYELEIPESLEAFYEAGTIKAISRYFSLREISEEIFNMMRSYDSGTINFDDHFLNEWLLSKLSFEEREEEQIKKKELEKELMRYVEMFVSKILWNVYSGDLNAFRKDLSGIVYLFGELRDTENAIGKGEMG